MFSFGLDETVDSGLLAAAVTTKLEAFSDRTLTSSGNVAAFPLSTVAEVVLPALVCFTVENLRFSGSFFPFLLGECFRAENAKLLC
jgi:hypothetical protein